MLNPSSPLLLMSLSVIWLLSDPSDTSTPFWVFSLMLLFVMLLFWPLSTSTPTVLFVMLLSLIVTLLAEFKLIPVVPPLRVKPVMLVPEPCAFTVMVDEVPSLLSIAPLLSKFSVLLIVSAMSV